MKSFYSFGLITAISLISACSSNTSPQSACPPKGGTITINGRTDSLGLNDVTILSGSLGIAESHELFAPSPFMIVGLSLDTGTFDPQMYDYGDPIDGWVRVTIAENGHEAGSFFGSNKDFSKLDSGNFNVYWCK